MSVRAEKELVAPVDPQLFDYHLIFMHGKRDFSFTVEERKLVWLRAARVPWKAITFEFGCDRTTAWRRWTLALTKIASRLNAH